MTKERTVPRMRGIAPPLRRGALLIRGRNKHRHSVRSRLCGAA